MHRAGIHFLILALAAVTVGCLDTGDDRTARDFDEIGHAQVGPVALYLDPGVALEVDAANATVRFRANAPTLLLTARSSATAPQVIHVEITNVFADMVLLPAQATATAGPHAIAFDLTVPAEGTTVRLARPDVETPRPFRFAWVGDVQGGNATFARVRQRIDADPGLEFVVFSGDVTDNGQPDQIQAFVATADALAVPWYSLFGNHEAISGDDEAFQRRIGRINVAFDYRGSRFVWLDSASGALNPRVWTFLQDHLQGTAPPVRLAAMHIPPLDFAGLRDGGFGSRIEGAKVMGALSQGGVDTLFSGHFHTLHLGGNAGVQAVVSGNGGVGFEAQWDGSSLHFLAVTVDPTLQSVEVGVVPVD